MKKPISHPSVLRDEYIKLNHLVDVCNNRALYLEDYDLAK